MQTSEAEKDWLRRICGGQSVTEIEQEENEVVFFLLSFSDLSHHRTCRSAYGGSYFGFHSRYESVRHKQPAFFRFSVDIAVLTQQFFAMRQWLWRALPIDHALSWLIPHLMRFATFVFVFFQAFHIHMRILRLNHSSVSWQRRFILAR